MNSPLTSLSLWEPIGLIPFSSCSASSTAVGLFGKLEGKKPRSMDFFKVSITQPTLILVYSSHQMFGFFLVFSVLGTLILSLLFISCFAMGLLALCEYVEQKPNYLKKLVKKIIYAIAVVHICFILFDCISLWRFIFSLLVLALHFRLQQDLPKVPLIPALVNVAAVFMNHVLWLSYFFRNDHPLWEVIPFYFFIVWAAPTAIAISYSTSELLPGFYEGASIKSHKRY